MSFLIALAKMTKKTFQHVHHKSLLSYKKRNIHVSGGNTVESCSVKLMKKIFLKSYRKLYIRINHLHLDNNSINY